MDGKTHKAVHFSSSPGTFTFTLLSSYIFTSREINQSGTIYQNA